MGGSGMGVGQEGPQLPGLSPRRLQPPSPPLGSSGQLIPPVSPTFLGSGPARPPTLYGCPGHRRSFPAVREHAGCWGRIVPGHYFRGNTGTQTQGQAGPQGLSCPLLQGAQFQPGAVLLATQCWGAREQCEPAPWNQDRKAPGVSTNWPSPCSLDPDTPKQVTIGDGVEPGPALPLRPPHSLRSDRSLSFTYKAYSTCNIVDFQTRPC